MFRQHKIEQLTSDKSLYKPTCNNFDGISWEGLKLAANLFWSNNLVMEEDCVEI